MNDKQRTPITKARDKYQKKMQKAGIKRINVWVPENEKQQILQLAKELRKEAIKKYLEAKL